MRASPYAHLRMLPGLVLLLLLCLPLAACVKQSAAEAPPLLEPENVSLDTAVIKRGDFYRIKQYRASLRAYTQEVYFGETRLNIKRIFVRAGQAVEKGAKIAELDAEDLEEAIADQEEILRHLKLVYDHDNRMKQYDIDIAGVQLQASEAGADPHDLELQRIEVQKQLSELSYQQETQRLELQKQEKKLEELRAELGLTVITAPFDGVVVYVDELWEGSPAVPFRPVAYVADPAQLFVEYNGAEYLVTSGEITAQIGDQTFALEYVPLESDKQLKYILDGRVPPAKLSILGDTSGLTAGQFAAVYVKSDVKEDTLLAPVNAVYTESGVGSYVYVMTDGAKTLRQVKVGGRNDSYAEILEGLTEGEEVFVKQ